MKHPNRRSFLGQLGAVTGVALAGSWAGIGGCSERQNRVEGSSSTHPSSEDSGASGAPDAQTRPSTPSQPGSRAAADGGSAGAAADESDAGLAQRAPDMEVVLRAVLAQAQILPGAPTAVWTLRGELVRGPAATLEAVPSGALGPTLHVRRGQRVRITLDNQLAENTILHWHGLQVPADMDGHPRSVIAPGAQYVYEFEVTNRAGTYFYHAHPDGRTGEQVYRGMAGLLIVHDDERDALLLPAGEYDVSLALQDRIFDADNQLVYQPSAHLMAGWLGDRVLVNGTSDYVLSAATRPYLFRVLNASNARIYRLAFQDATPLTVIGSDGGLLEQPVQRPYVMLGPGERVELWVDLTERELGSELQLVSLEFTASPEMGPASPGAPQGAPLPIMRVRLDSKSSQRDSLPDRLSTIAAVTESEASNAATPHRIVTAMQHMRWTLNGRVFELDRVAADERAKLGELEIWQFENPAAGVGMMHGGGMMRGGGMMMQMPHPMHLHGGQFLVLGRTGVQHEGYIDEGFKDTVLVMPGETVKIAMRFEKYTGLFLYHCHNLEHEDQGMMRNLEVYS